MSMTAQTNGHATIEVGGAEDEAYMRRLEMDERMRLERTILAGIIMSDEIAQIAISKCQPDMFYKSFHCAIFDAMRRLHERDAEVTVATITDEMVPPFSDKAVREMMEILTSLPDPLIEPNAVERFAAGSGGGPLIVALPWRWVEPTKIRPREWLYGRHYIRKFVSATLAAGGVGKSTLAIAEAIAMASGKAILGTEPKHPLRVWYWNLEDPGDELDRRVAATCKHYGITEQDLGGRLFVNDGREMPCKIAEMNRDGAYIVEPVAGKIVSEMREKQIDILIIDPFVSCHYVPENDNGAIDMVVKAWAAIADETNSSVELIHHLRKQNEKGEVSVDDGRGASSFGAGARSVRGLSRMTKEEGEKANVENPKLFFRLTPVKANLAPPPDASDWFRLESVDLENGTPADHVGVCASWEWPSVFADLTIGQVREVQRRVAAGEYLLDSQAKNWVGNVVAEVTEKDLKADGVKPQIKKQVTRWIEGSALKIVERENKWRKTQKFVEVGNYVG